MPETTADTLCVRLPNRVLTSTRRSRATFPFGFNTRKLEPTLPNSDGEEFLFRDRDVSS
jgi:hypothetical protein